MDITTTTLFEYEINKLNKKVSKLENIIQRMTTENKLLKAKVSTLESVLSKVCNKLELKMPQIQESKISSQTNKNLNTIEETWLYYIPTKLNLTKEKIIFSLKFSEADLTYIDIKANWKTESEMFVSILENFSSFSEFSSDFKEFPLQQLIECFEEIFEVAILSDIILVIRSIPSTKNKKIYDKLIDYIGSLAGVMFKTFSKQISNSEKIGRMALILEVEEEMNIINIVKNDSRVLLSVEKLNC